MAESIIQDWLAEYESLEDPSEVHTFAIMHEHNQEISESIYTIFNERLKYPDLIHAICNQFLSFYRSKEEQLKRFTLQFLPVLINIYLNSVVIGDKKNCRSVETLLISIYNVEVSTEDGLQKTVSFRMPVLAQASIYHEEKSLHATDLRRWEDHSNRDVKWGPFPQIESINAQNRMKVMAALLFAYNQQLSLMQKSALFHLCRIASQIVNQGFSKTGHAHRSSYGTDPNSVIVPKPLPRIPLSSQFLVELVHSIYFAMFNDFGTVAIQTLEDIHHRATYEMFTDLILVTNAVRNSLHANPSGQPSDGPMGLSVALTPATNTVVVSKSMITNASFRTKKLPDDIPIQDEHTSGSALMSITEETEKEQQIGTRNSGIRSSKDGGSSSISSGVGGIKAQAHKALIAGFKKSKDLKAAAVTTIANKNNNADIVKEILGPPKPPIRKDKHLIMNRTSLTTTTPPTNSGSGSDNIDYSNQTKNILLHDNTNNGITTADIIPLQNYNTNNGGNFHDKNIEKPLENLDKMYNNNDTTNHFNNTNNDLLTTELPTSLIMISGGNNVNGSSSNTTTNNSSILNISDGNQLHGSTLV